MSRVCSDRAEKGVDNKWYMKKKNIVYTCCKRDKGAKLMASPLAPSPCLNVYTVDDAEQLLRKYGL